MVKVEEVGGNAHGDGEVAAELVVGPGEAATVSVLREGGGNNVVSSSKHLKNSRQVSSNSVYDYLRTLPYKSPPCL